MNALHLQLKKLLEITESEDYNHQSSKYHLLEKECEEIISQIRDYLKNTEDKEEIEKIIKSDPEILYLLRVDLVFDLFHKVFMLGSLDKDLITTFAYFIHAYGPDWDEESKKIEEYVAENKFQEAVKIALSIKCYD
ncbi:MAG: hypothetical protein WB502_01285 [Thermoactinomyces sp.]